MNTTMVAKFRVTSVQSFGSTSEPVTSERITMSAVSDKPFDPSGNSDDNTFARWTPSGELTISIQNPALFGKIKEGQKYYLNFAQAEN